MAAGCRSGADGAFRVEGLRTGLPRPVLFVPRPAEVGDWLRMELGARRVPAEGRSDFDIDGDIDRPAVVRGRLAFSGARPPLRRLAIQWTRRDELSELRSPGLPFEIWRTVAHVAGDGSFAAMLPPGRVGLRVFDVTTSIALYELDQPLDLDRGEQRDLELELALGVIELQLTDVACDEAGPATRLVFEREQDDYMYGAPAVQGFDVQGRLVNHLAYAPAADYAIHLTRSRLSEQRSLFLFAMPHYVLNDYHGTEEDLRVTVKAGQRVRVEVEVPRRLR